MGAHIPFEEWTRPCIEHESFRVMVIVLKEKLSLEIFETDPQSSR
jgi:hypothetical protein